VVGREAQGQAKIFTKMRRPSLLSDFLGDLSSSLRLDLYQLHHLSSLYLWRAPDLQTSIPPCLEVATPERVSRAPELHTSTSARLQRTSRSPNLHASTSLHLYRASRAPYLHVCAPATRFQISVPPRLHACSAPPELYILHAYSRPPDLQNSIPRRRYRTPYLDVATELHTSTLLHLQRASRALYLHVCTLAAGLQISIPPRLHAYSALTDLHTSTPRRRYTCSALPVLHTSTSAYLQRASRALYSARLQRTSRPPYLDVATTVASFHTSTSRLFEGPTTSIATSYNFTERDTL